MTTTLPTSPLNLINPIKYERTLRSLTQANLAAQAHVTPQVVLNAEQGLYQSLPLSILLTLDLDPDEYRSWVTAQRFRNQHQFDRRVIRSRDWLTFRLSVSPSFRGFCRLLVYQLSLLRDFELHKQRNNASLSEALSQVGLTNDELRTLGISHG